VSVDHLFDRSTGRLHPVRPGDQPAGAETAHPHGGPATRPGFDRLNDRLDDEERRPAVLRRSGRAVFHVGLHVVGAAVTGGLVGVGVRSVAPDKNAQWILGRASGLSCLLLLTVLAVSGLMLSHPWRARRLRPNQTMRIRAHVSLAVFTLALFVVHVVVLATDPWAKVGWWGAFLPMASSFRPVSVTLGVVAGYSGLVSGVTAAFAGRWAATLWAPLHRAAALALVLAWLHGLFAGSDTDALLPFYLGSGALVMIVGMSRYVARTPKDRIRELIESARSGEEDDA
jgi:hypothetical protein